MLGGDEVSALVIDLGSHTCKAGYAGDDVPKAVFPSSYGYMAGPGGDREEGGRGGEGEQPQKRVKLESERGDNNSAGQQQQGQQHQQPQERRQLFVGSTAMGFRRDYMEVEPAVKGGLLTDWDAVEAMWEHAIRDRLQVDPSEYALLVAEPSFNTAANREKTLQLIFDTLNPPAVFCAKNAVLTSFSCGKGTAVVVDCGGSGTTVAAVHDGYLLKKSVIRSPVGGDMLTDSMLKLVEGSKYNIKIRPRYSFRRKELSPGDFQLVEMDFPHTTPSYKLYQQRLVASDLKESLCRVPDTSFDETSFAQVPTMPYELPDGQVVELGGDRFRVADIPFNPGLVKSIAGMEGAFDGPIPQGLTRMVLECIGNCDADIRRELFSSVLVSGGTMTMPQMKERLERELLENSPPTAKVKVLASGNMIERKFSVWIGGSILASLGSFQQLWLSKSEFEEHGAAYVHRKCP